MKIAFIWTNISGYMSSCWHELNSYENVEVCVCAYEPSEFAPFDKSILGGLDYTLLSREERVDLLCWKEYVNSVQADVYVICGWVNPHFEKLALYIKSKGSKVVVVLDTPFEGKLRQYLTRFRYKRLFDHTDMFVATGERSYQYALRFGISAPIRRGLYGVQYNQLKLAYARRCKSNWPRAFLFIGRYSKEKNLELLLKAYAEYRSCVDAPWSLICCGTGPMKALLSGQSGVEDRGFCQPSEIVDVMAASGAFVLPSEFDPWPLVIVEACSSGLPVICSQACGSVVENVRDYYNGIHVETGNVSDMTRALIEVHMHHQDLPTWGARSQQLAAAFSSAAWATRWSRWLQNLLKEDV